MRRTLLITNIFTLLIAIACLIAAGIIDPQPLHRLGTTGAQLTLASIYVIFLSLIGLYGTRLKKPNLLLIYGYSILIVLILRSISSLISIYFFKSGTKVIFSMVLALFEVTLATLAIAVAFNLKNMQQLKPETSSIQKVWKVCKLETQKDTIVQTFQNAKEIFFPFFQQSETKSSFNDDIGF